jgi:hypothetical protein
MSRRTKPKLRDPFHHPTSEEVDFERLLAAMRNCHAEVMRFWQQCGLRNSAQQEARALLAQLCAVAALTRVPGAEALVNPPIESHSTPR